MNETGVLLGVGEGGVHVPAKVQEKKMKKDRTCLFICILCVGDDHNDDDDDTNDAK